MSWATATTTLGVALVAAGAALLGGWLQRRSDRVERHRDRELDRREKIAAVLGPVVRLLDETGTDRILFNLGPGSAAAQEDRWARGQVLHTELLTLALGHPSAEVEARLKELGVALLNTLHSTGWLVHGWVRTKVPDADDRTQARADHVVAEEAVEAVRAAVRSWELDAPSALTRR